MFLEIPLASTSHNSSLVCHLIRVLLCIAGKARKTCLPLLHVHFHFILNWSTKLQTIFFATRINLIKIMNGPYYFQMLPRCEGRSVSKIYSPKCGYFGAILEFFLPETFRGCCSWDLAWFVFDYVALTLAQRSLFLFEMQSSLEAKCARDYSGEIWQLSVLETTLRRILKA